MRFFGLVAHPHLAVVAHIFGYAGRALPLRFR